MANDAWGTTSGFRSDYELTVTESFWSPPTDKNPNWSLIWNGVDEDGEEVEKAVQLGAGAKWASFDGGESVDHEEGNETKGGKPRQFHTNSGVGGVIDVFVNEVDEEVLEKFESPRFSNVWVGTIWYMGEVTNTFPDRTDKSKMVTIKKVLPVEFRGFVDDDGTGRNSGNGNSNPQSSGSTVDNSTFNPEVVEKLRALAVASADHATFMNEALGLPEVPVDDSLVIAVSQEDFFQKLVNGDPV